MWKPKGHYDLQLWGKGFFTIIFFNMEDKNQFQYGGPYFFNSAGLLLRQWKMKFNRDKEDLTVLSVWIRMYSLPTEYSREEILEDLGKTIGKIFKSLEQTKEVRYISYARIHVYMDLSRELPEAINLSWEDEEWIQDYIMRMFHSDASVSMSMGTCLDIFLSIN